MDKKSSSESKVELTKIDTSPLTYLLPTPSFDGEISVEKALSHRRSHRYFSKSIISAEKLSQVLWAAYGISCSIHDYPSLRGGLRTAPSAGGCYPLEIYVLVGNVKQIEPGVYKYLPEGHKIFRTVDKDIRNELAKAAWSQEMISEAPACLFYSAIFERATQRYGKRGRERYVCMDLGHSAQNVYLQMDALYMGTCAVGAFEDDKVREVMNLPEEEEPLYIMPFGYYYDKPKF